jgi:hypothetical protein
VSGYVLDDLALSAGLAGIGNEHHRREVSRLLRGAIDGGPRLDVPALCLTAATAMRPALADHLADIVAAAPPDAIKVSALARSAVLDTLRMTHPHLAGPVPTPPCTLSSVACRSSPSDRYRGVAIDVLSL